MKRNYIGSALLACLLLLSVAIPFANATATAVDGGITKPQLTTDLTTDSAFEYHVYPKYVDYNRYAGGWMYNTAGELRNAYDLNPLYAAGYDGSGQTVVIIDAYGSPTIYDDLLSFILWQNTRFDLTYKLPWTTMADVTSHLHIYYPDGQPVFNASDGEQIGWSIEITLDVDMVHAIAPNANIALVIAPDSQDVSLNHAVLYSITHHLGSTISQSWGSPEYELTGRDALRSVLKAHATYMLAALSGITVFASTGDWGATNGEPVNNALFPASDPYVVGVGGTNLYMNCLDGFKEGTGSWDGNTHFGSTYSYEIAGNDYEAQAIDGYPSPYVQDIVTTGGAMSTLFPLPCWQRGITLTDTSGAKFKPTGRCTSDVSFDSGVYGGLGAVPWSAASPGSPIYYIIGGTSAGSPFWAALTAIACQYTHHRLGYINPQLYACQTTLYKAGAIHDITMGDNTYPTGNTVLGYEATVGWDAPTGIGSPDCAILVQKMKCW